MWSEKWDQEPRAVKTTLLLRSSIIFSQRSIEFDGLAVWRRLACLDHSKQMELEQLRGNWPL
jgi:hypothetical protein